MKLTKENLWNYIGSEVRVVKSNNKTLNGKYGTLTSPFGNHDVSNAGIILHEPIEGEDCYNLSVNDEIIVL
jgi:hypothetical protein